MYFVRLDYTEAIVLRTNLLDSVPVVPYGLPTAKDGSGFSEKLGNARGILESTALPERKKHFVFSTSVFLSCFTSVLAIRTPHLRREGR